MQPYPAPLLAQGGLWGVLCRASSWTQWPLRVPPSSECTAWQHSHRAGATGATINMACLLGQNTKFNTLGNDSLHKQQELRGSPAAKVLEAPTETSLNVPQGALVLSRASHVPGNTRRRGEHRRRLPLLCRWLQVRFSEAAARLRLVLAKASPVERCGPGTGHWRSGRRFPSLEAFKTWLHEVSDKAWPGASVSPALRVLSTAFLQLC